LICSVRQSIFSYVNASCEALAIRLFCLLESVCHPKPTILNAGLACVDPLAVQMGKEPAVDLVPLRFIPNLWMLQVVPYFGNLPKT
jgi:hypothetical protein